MSTLLWAKGDSIDKLMQKLTVGNDYLIDREMVVWDCIGSAAHARMLHFIGILSKEDVTALLRELKNIFVLGQNKQIEIPIELEDVHNVIENMLVDKVGDAGLRIHAGRARNDQILVTTRLHLRHMLMQLLLKIADFAHSCVERYDELKDIQMPGYTHMQPAMPSSVGMWLHSFIEASLELLKEGLMLLEIINVNPLGASAGFGSNIPLDRNMTTRLLGFARTQRSPIDCNNSRGRFEHKVLSFGVEVAGMLEKFACDMMLYTTQEYKFFSLPVELTTGSSIMPQKRNSDLAELLRARAGKIRAAENELAWITAKLTSSYNRDFQYTKEPVIRAEHELSEMLSMGVLLVSRFEVNKERVAAAMYPELYATYEANRLAQSGMPYRLAYRTVAQKVKQNDYDKSGLVEDFLEIARQIDTLVIEAKAELVELEKQSKKLSEQFTKIEGAVFNWN
ncbi:MAG: argininosuccinate lyase [Deltaproteobacteria bacterium]|nr:argininosuccinate lyase [Deltaproteobacteria bacterium]